MASFLRSAYDIFWSKTFWLPGEFVEWEDLINKDDGIYHPQLWDLVTGLYLSFVITLIRYLFNRYFAKPAGKYFGLTDKVKRATPNADLENAYKIKKSPTNDTVQTLSKKTEMPTREIERWFRIRRNQDRTPGLNKFCESLWRGFVYFFLFWFGVYVHIDKSWFYKTVYAWDGWPHHHISDDIYWYYMIELGFYFSLSFSLCLDTRRKDFAEMIIHHAATIILMAMSWVNNFVRIGTLVLLVHDAVDSWLEGAKVAKYIKFEKLCTTIFFIFMVVWVITRLIIFPFRIIRSTMFEAIPAMTSNYIPIWSIYGVYNLLLCTLQVLHIIWFYYICLIAKGAITGKIEKDSRSSPESASESNEEVNDKKTLKASDNSLPSGVRTRNGVIRAAAQPSC